MQFGKQNNYKEFIYSKPVIIGLVIVGVLLSKSVHERFGVEREMADRRDLSEEELNLQKQRKVELQERVEYLEGKRGIEEEIRKNFDVAKEGEQVIILIGNEENELIPLEVSPETYPWYQFWR